MIVALTGGSGMIGWQIANKHLALGHHVRILSRKKNKNLDLRGAQFIEGNLPEEKNIDLLLDGADIFYHCAGELRQEEKMYDVHVKGTELLLRHAQGRVKRWVQLSSVGVYGPQTKGLIEESHPYNPINTYEKTKLESDLRVLDFCKKNEMDYSILRPSNVFGTTDENHFIIRILRGLQRGRFAFVGRPGASGNFIFHKNVAYALYLCGTHPKAIGNIYIVSDYVPLEKFIDLCKRDLHLKGKTPRLPEFPLRVATFLLQNLSQWPIKTKQIDALTTRSVYSNKKIENELAYKAPFSIEDGIKEVMQTFKL